MSLHPLEIQALCLAEADFSPPAGEVFASVINVLASVRIPVVDIRQSVRAEIIALADYDFHQALRKTHLASLIRIVLAVSKMLEIEGHELFHIPL